MAAQNAFGLRWMGFSLSGAPIGVQSYGKPSSDGTAIFMGDVLMKVASSVTNPAGGNPMPSCKTAVGNGTPGTGLWLGVSLNYGAASAATEQLVIDDPSALFYAQCDDSAAETIASKVGKNANFVLTAGNATTKQSQVVIDHTTIATTSTRDVRIRQFVNNVGVNPDNAAYPIFEVEIVLHQFANKQTTGV
jgi:hypothetical protein